MSNSSSTIIFHYDMDKLIGFNYNGSEYIYQRNIQGDITHIYDEDGMLLCRYVYDAYGNHSVINYNGSIIGNINPFRYRGYYYDDESKLYYCNNRYYSPELCRWISPDSFEYLNPQDINGLNLYMYCMDNPIMMVDPSVRSFRT